MTRSTPPAAIYFLVFDVPSTDNPQINFANIAGEFPSDGVQTVEASKIYMACFDGNSWKLIDDDEQDDNDLILNGNDLANCYQDSERPTTKEIFEGKLGLTFTGSSSVQPLSYGIFIPKIDTVYNMVVTFQPTSSLTDKQKNITARFVDSRPESGDGIINSVTKVDVDIPDDPDEFQVIFEKVLDTGMISAFMEGRWEIEVEDAANFNHEGNLFMSRVQIIRVDI